MKFGSCRWLGALFLAVALGVSSHARADRPSFTGRSVQASGATTLVNLRGQGAIAGTAPMNVQVNAVRVGGILSPLISIVRTILQPGVNTSVCVQVQNLLGLDLTFLGVEMDVTAFNAEAPAGITGRVVIQTGLGGEDVSPLACADTVRLPPSANAGPDQDIGDTDRAAGENVTLNGAASSDPDGSIVSYQWMNSGNQVIATGPTARVRLPDGRQTITLLVTDNTGVSSTDTVTINVAAPATNRLPIARAGGNRIVADTDRQAGENVALDGTQSTDPDGTVASYQWLIGASTVLATTATATVRLPDGPQTITLKVTDNQGGVSTDTATITVGAPNPAVAPTAKAGPDRVVADTDGIAGENVALDGTQSTDPDGTISTYQWQRAGQTIATGATAQVRLPDGENFLTLIVTDNAGNTASVAQLITIRAPAGIAPVANAGADRTVNDTDGTAGEIVTLDGSASADPDGTIVTYEWKLGTQPLANSAVAAVRLPDGANVVTLTVFDNIGNSASAAVQITVGAPPTVAVLSAIPGLTPNQREVAVALDSLCPRLQRRALSQALTTGETSLLTHCNALFYTSTVQQQIKALDEINPQDLNATRNQTMTMSRSQLTNVAERLTALRRGARGVSLAGLNFELNGKNVPVAEVASSAGKVFGGGASSDADRGGLLDSPLGFWLRGNYGFGEKVGTTADHGFDSDQWGVVGGADYRFTPRYVVGVAFGYGSSKVSFNPVDSGELTSRAVSGSLYATMYSQGSFYADAIVTYLHSSYDSKRHLAFDTDTTSVDATANAQTGGTTLGAAFSVGYDWWLGGLMIAPSVGYNFLSSRVDAFREHGADGLDLAYESQDYASALASAMLRISYAWRTPIGVIMPHVRAEYLREFIQDDESFRVRFANDPFSDTPLMIIRADAPDQSYWRLAAGFAAQFKHGISAFAEYERISGQQYLTYTDMSLGLRIEAGF